MVIFSKRWDGNDFFLRPKKARDDKLSHFNKMKIDHDEERIAMRGFSICKMKIFTVDCLTFAQFLIPFADPLVCNNTSTALAAPLLLAGRRNEHWPLSSFRPACCRLCAAASLAPAPRLDNRVQRQRQRLKVLCYYRKTRLLQSHSLKNSNKTTHCKKNVQNRDNNTGIFLIKITFFFAPIYSVHCLIMFC